MRATAEELEILKSQLRAMGGFYERESLRGESFSLAQGGITQISGHGKTEVLVKFLASLKDLSLAWVESELSLNPVAMEQRNLNLKNVLLVEAREHWSWASLQVLQSSLFDVVVLSFAFKTPSGLKDIKLLRRLQLAAERSKCCLVILLDEVLSAWPVTAHFRSSQNHP